MKKIVKIALCVIMVFLLVGCSNKKGVSAKEFEDILVKENFYVNDITGNNLGASVKKILIADNKKYQIEYYSFKTDDGAKDSYKSNKKLFKNYKEKNSKETEKKHGNYSAYSLELKDSYLSVIRSGNTLVYTWSKIEYKNDLIKLFKKLNY